MIEPEVVFCDLEAEIGWEAFFICESLESIDFGNSKLAIGDRAFSHCFSLQSVTLPETIEKIGAGAFGYTSTKNENFIVKGYDDTVAHKYAQDNGFEFISLNEPVTEPVTDPPTQAPTKPKEKFEYVVEDEYNIKITAYNGTDQNLVIPNTIDGYYVSGIGEEVFLGNESIQSVTIPYTLLYIEDSAFASCRKLESVNMGTYDIELGDSVFSDCISLREVDLPMYLEEIPDNTFYGCKSLESIYIPMYVKSIGKRAFYKCSSLQSVFLTDSVVYIGKQAFGYGISHSTDDMAKQLTISCFEGTAAHKYAIENNIQCEVIPLYEYTTDGKTATLTSYNGAGADLVIPSTIDGYTVTRLGYCLFENSMMKYVTIPESVTYIEWGVFDNCYNLERVYISDIDAWSTMGFQDSSSNPLSNGAQLYLNDELVTEVVLSDSVESISSYAFNSCTSITSVTIPDSVESIGFRAFGDCTSLKSVEIPESVTFIEEEAFGYYLANNFYYDYYKKDDSFVIYGYDRSAAQRYAEENGFEYVSMNEPPPEPTLQPMEPQPPINLNRPHGLFFSNNPQEDINEEQSVFYGYLGDVDGDLEVSVMDATFIQMVLVGLAEFDTYGEYLADTDNDSSVSVMDSLEILRNICGLSYYYPIGYALYEKNYYQDNSDMFDVTANVIKSKAYDSIPGVYTLYYTVNANGARYVYTITYNSHLEAIIIDGMLYSGDNLTLNTRVTVYRGSTLVYYDSICEEYEEFVFEAKGTALAKQDYPELEFDLTCSEYMSGVSSYEDYCDVIERGIYLAYTVAANELNTGSVYPLIYDGFDTELANPEIPLPINGTYFEKLKYIAMKYGRLITSSESGAKFYRVDLGGDYNLEYNLGSDSIWLSYHYLSDMNSFSFDTCNYSIVFYEDQEGEFKYTYDYSKVDMLFRTDRIKGTASISGFGRDGSGYSLPVDEISCGYSSSSSVLVNKTKKAITDLLDNLDEYFVKKNIEITVADLGFE